MAKPQLLRNELNKPEGIGDGADEEGGAVVAKGRGREGVLCAALSSPPPPTCRANSSRREGHLARDQEDGTEQGGRRGRRRGTGEWH